MTNRYRSYVILNNGELEDVPFNKARKVEEQTETAITGPFKVL